MLHRQLVGGFICKCFCYLSTLLYWHSNWMEICVRNTATKTQDVKGQNTSWVERHHRTLKSKPTNTLLKTIKSFFLNVNRQRGWSIFIWFFLTLLAGDTGSDSWETRRHHAGSPEPPLAQNPAETVHRGQIQILQQIPVHQEWTQVLHPPTETNSLSSTLLDTQVI